MVTGFGDSPNPPRSPRSPQQASPKGEPFGGSALDAFKSASNRFGGAPLLVFRSNMSVFDNQELHTLALTTLAAFDFGKAFDFLRTKGPCKGGGVYTFAVSHIRICWGSLGRPYPP